MLPFDDKVKLLELSRLMRGFRFLSTIEGVLTTKRGPRANHEKKRITKLIKESASRYGWKKSPRAKIAVIFRFVDVEQNKADITRLVKFYLDLLKGTVFDDDRQVYFLEAVTWRMQSESKEQEKSKVMIEVHHLFDYIRLLDYACEVDLDYEDEDDEYCSIKPNFSLEPNHWNISEAQSASLSGLKISIYDRPGFKIPGLQTMMSSLSGSSPFIFDLGGLPQDCGNNQFVKKLQDEMGKFKKEIDLFDTIYVPVDLDVQVSSSGVKLGKDLDNIMLQVGNVFRKELLHKHAYLSGYRIYVVEDELKESGSEIKAQLLPEHAISKFSIHISNKLEKYKESLDEFY